MREALRRGIEAVKRGEREAAYEFFREAATFDVLKKKIFPGIVKARTGDDRIRIWVPGCSTGEEVYSIAICLLECLDDISLNAPIQIFVANKDELVRVEALQQLGGNQIDRQRTHGDFPSQSEPIPHCSG